MKAGEDNPQAREEEGKLSLLRMERSSLQQEFPECEDWNSMGKPLLSLDLTTKSFSTLKLSLF